MRLLTILLATWLFWLLVSFWNFGFLMPFGVPLLLPFAPRFYAPFENFFHWPLRVGAGAALITALVFIGIPRGILLFVATLAVNLAFLVAFVSTAEIRHFQSVAAALSEVQPDCSQSRSFLSSLSIAGGEFQTDPHGVYRKGDRVFLWSYRDQAFFEVPVTIYKNLDLGRCGPHFAMPGHQGKLCRE
jgi:hypothetical protein